MKLPANGWKNKNGTGNRSCRCGSWKNHWLNFSGTAWPNECSVYKCHNSADLGAHICNSKVSGERIIPMCLSCNRRTDTFSLKEGVTLVSANKSETCEK